ncbi:MAG: glutathione S-transferase family protein [Pseudomonadota bacterium]|nr:glutathione S-transferase family protein [Pseudomonadota bacterium]
MKLYSVPLSPFAARVRLAIYHKGLDIEIVPPPAEGLKSPAYLALNPMGQVPVLEIDTGGGIPDSGAILEYLEDVFPSPSLRPESLEDLARARLFMRIPDVQFNSAPRILFGMRNPEDRKPDLMAAAFENIERALDNMGHFLDDDAGPWAIGGKVSIADCAAVPVLNVISRLATTFKRDDLLKGRPKLHAYWQAAQQDPINARVIEEQRAALSPQ